MKTRSLKAGTLALIALLISPLAVFAADEAPRDAGRARTQCSPENRSPQMQERMQSMRSRMHSMENLSDTKAMMPMMRAQMQDMQAMMQDIDTGCTMHGGSGMSGPMTTPKK